MRQIWDRNYINGCILEAYILFATKMAREVPPPFCWAQSEAGRVAVSSARRVHPRTRAGGEAQWIQVVADHAEDVARGRSTAS